MPGSHSKKIRKGYAVGGTTDERLSDIRKIYSKNDPSKVARGPEVSGVPKHFGLGKHRVDLAYITPDEAKLLKNLDMHGTTPPNTGPEIQNIPNYNGWGDRDTFGSTANTDPSSGTGNTTGSGDSNTANGGFNDTDRAAHQANVDKYNADAVARAQARKDAAMLDKGYVKTNFNLKDPKNPLAGYQFNATAAARANMSEDESYSAALAELGFNPDGTPVTTGIGTSEDLGFSTNLGFDSISDVATLANIGFDPNFGMSTEDLSLRDTLATSALSEMSLPERQAYAESVNATDDLSLGFGLKDVDSTEPSFTDKIKDMYNGVVDVVDKAGYESWKSEYTKKGIPAPGYNQYKAMTMGLGDLFGGFTNYASENIEGFKNNKLKTAGSLSVDLADAMTMTYGGLPSFNTNLSMARAGLAIFDGTPAITGNFGRYNLPTGVDPMSLAKMKADGTLATSFSGSFANMMADKYGYGVPNQENFDTPTEYKEAVDTYNNTRLNRTAADFDKVAAAGGTFKENKIAGSLTKSQYATAVANGMFPDPEMAAAYRSQAELNKAKEKEASRGGRPVNDDVANAANMGQDLTILTEYGTQIYNQLLTSGYDSGYAYRYALQLD